jgi:hypothetical protein
MATRGRKTHLTSETQKTICDAIRSGLPRERAAALAKIARPTLQLWIVEGERGREPYQTFAEAIYLAEAEMQQGCIKEIRSAGTKVRNKNGGEVTISPYWQAKAWLLERRFPKEFGRANLDTVLAAEAVETAKRATEAAIPTNPEQVRDILRQCPPALLREVADEVETEADVP